MNWRTFWAIFCTTQLVGVALAMLALVHSFYAVIAGMILLFPGSLIVSASSELRTVVLVVAIMLAINVAFWIAILRPHTK